MQDVGKGMHEAGLAHARNALEQHVPAGQQAGHGGRDDLLLSDDALADFTVDANEALAEQIDVLGDGGSHFWRMK